MYKIKIEIEHLDKPVDQMEVKSTSLAGTILLAIRWLASIGPY